MHPSRAGLPWSRLHQKVVEDLRTWHPDTEGAELVADCIVNDAMDTARSLIHTTCFAFGHLWPDPPKGRLRWFKTDWSRRCSACGVHRRCVDQEASR